MKESVALYGAAFNGDWDAAKELLMQNESLIKTPITDGGETALHIAAMQGHEYFVTKLLETMEVGDINIQNEKMCTPLCFAAAAGHTPIARIMVSASVSLPTIKGENGISPLYMAAVQGFDETADFLYPISDFGLWTVPEKIELLTTAISSGLYGLAMRIVDKHNLLAITEDDNGETPLLLLARNPLAFHCNNRQEFWVKIMRNVLPYMKSKTHNRNRLDDAYSLFDCLWNAIEVLRKEDIEAVRGIDTLKLFFVAAECGNDDFLVELIRRDHNFLYKINGSMHSIFHIAVLHRYVRVFNLIYELGGFKDLMTTYIDTDNNNILHLAGKLAPKNQLNCIPGEALQMQREVLWFKEVEKLVRPSYKTMKNNDGYTPHELFLVEHEGLMKEGEKSMKQTAKACMLVAMLIATVVYTMTFTVPGGYDNTTGNPILKNKRLFIVFPVFEAVAMLSSLTSMLMFLSLLTSRYSHEDFLRTLPFSLVVGLASLFISMVAMMVVFCSCLLFYEHGWAAVTLLLGFFASVPIMFVVLKCPFVAILCCTYSCTWLFRSYDRLHF